MIWPAFEEALAWLQAVCASQGLGGKGWQEGDLRVLLAAAGGRPSDVLAQLQIQGAKDAAQRWRALPKAVAAGHVAVLGEFSLPQAVDALQKLCHDLWALKVGAAPRFFALDTLPVFTVAGKDTGRGPSLYALGQWTKELSASARTAEHPYNPGLMLEALVSQAQLAMRGKSA